MNDRIDHATTPAARVAAVCIELIRRMQRHHDRLPDYADMTKELEPYVLEIELNARADEVRLARTGAIAERIVFLDRQIRGIKFRDDF